MEYIEKFVVPIRDIIKDGAPEDVCGIAIPPSSKSQGAPGPTHALLMLRERLIQELDGRVIPFLVSRTTPLSEATKRIDNYQRQTMEIVNEPDIFPPSILVLDDVFTTGSTMRGVIDRVRQHYIHHEHSEPEIFAVVFQCTYESLTETPPDPTGFKVVQHSL